MSAEVHSVRLEAQAYIKSYQWCCEAYAETCKLGIQRAEQEVERLQDELGTFKMSSQSAAKNTMRVSMSVLTRYVLSKLRRTDL